MPRSLFDQELNRLQSKLVAMGDSIAGIIEDTTVALRYKDLNLARRIVASDIKVNSMAMHIEQTCINLIARQQPLAQDLRIIVASSKIATDLERIADQCADICGIILRQTGLPQTESLLHILQMFTEAYSMFRQALIAYANQDAVLARQVCQSDDAIDNAFARLMLELSESLASGELQGSLAVDLILVAKYVERVADHVTNIGEWSIFIVSGVYIDLNFHNPLLSKYN